MSSALPLRKRQGQKHGSCSCCCCCCWCCTLLVLLFLLFILLATLFYFWFHPKLPEIHVESLKFTKFSMNPTPQGNEFDSQSSLVVQLTNPNEKLKIYYGNTKAEIKVDDGFATIGSFIMPAFVQDPGNTTRINLEANTHQILKDEVVEELNQGYTNKSLLVRAEVETAVGAWASGMIEMHALCTGMSLSQLEGGAGNMPKCEIKVHVFRWFAIRN